MTNEEAYKILENSECFGAVELYQEDEIEAFNVALEALKAESYEAVSREAVDEIKELMTDINGDTVYAVRMSDIRQLPPVTPARKRESGKRY